MTKIVYNACFGGFGISKAGMLRYAEIKGLTLYPEPYKDFPSLMVYYLVPPDQRTPEASNRWHTMTLEERRAVNAAHGRERFSDDSIDRADPALVQVVEELGKAAAGAHADLQIAEVPTGEQYRIDEYDGRESVMTVDSYDWKTA